MYYHRKLEKEIKKYLNIKEILLITGMRRTGKTFLLSHIFESIKSANKVFLNLENPIEQKIFEEIDYNNISRVSQLVRFIITSKNTVK